MPELDGGTIILLNGTVAGLMFLALRATQRALVQDAPAISHWSWAYGCFALSSLLYFLRGHAPTFLTVTLAGSLLTLGLLLLARGFYRIQARDIPLWVVIAATVGFFLLNGYFTHIQASYVTRVTLISLSGIVSYGAILKSYATERDRAWRVGEPLVLFSIATAFMAYLLRLADAISSPVDDLTSQTTVGVGALFSAYLLLLNVSQILLANGLLVLTQERVAKKLHDAVAHDALTGALSRSMILEILDSAWASARRNGDRWAVIMIDIDRFKAINDNFGHAVGDEALKHAVAIMREQLRLDSHLGRYGGEEFLVVARIRAAGEGRLLAERLRAAVANSPIQTEAGTLQCTLSAGVAELDPESPEDAGDPLDQADHALYDAKGAGRDRVMIATGQGRRVAIREAPEGSELAPSEP